MTGAPLRDLRRALADGFRRGLPGVEGQLPLSPRPRRGWQPGAIPDDHRAGAGLLLLYPREGEAHLVLTLRAETLPKHANQVSLPGGAVEPEESATDAALREAWEEISVDPAEVRIAGELSPLHIPVSGFVLHPFVGIAPRRPDFEPDPREVARILEIPLERLSSPESLREEPREFRGRTYRVPYFDVEGIKVWGATAMILSEFLTLIGRPPRPAPGNDAGH